MLVSDFHYDLPEDLIAQTPPAIRGTSRMLTLDRHTGAFADNVFTDLPQLLKPGDLLILNDSRVLPARLYATRAGLTTQHNSPTPTGHIEVLLTQRLASDHNDWTALVKPAKKVQPGETLHFAPTSPGAPGPDSRTREAVAPLLTAEVLASGDFGERTLRFAPVEDFDSTLARIGHMPLPPYIHRGRASPEDRERYQTVYGRQPGSAAAPTAGLHFTPEILAALAARGVEIATLTLHVGLGTFQPVRVSELKDIRLHAERYTLPSTTADALNRALREGRRIVAAGTTTTRTLEHIAQLATKSGAPHLDSEMWVLTVEPHSGSTSIFLAPGHCFRIVSGLLTNFHLPSSTLLMLTAAFAGAPTPEDPNRGRQTILAAYAHAIHQHYRFYSYGDCMLLL